MSGSVTKLLDCIDVGFAGGSTAYTYDVEDRLTDLTAPWGTVYSFGYDGEGRRTSLTSTSGRASTMGYTSGLLTALAHVQSGVSLTDLAYEYGIDGQLTAIPPPLIEVALVF